jgi:hypothetical protein
LIWINARKINLSGGNSFLLYGSEDESGRSAVRLRSRAMNFCNSGLSSAASDRYVALTGLASIEPLSREDWGEQGVGALVTAHGDARAVLETAKYAFEEVAAW